MLPLLLATALGLLSAAPSSAQEPSPPLEVSVTGKPLPKRDKTEDSTVIDGQRLRESARSSLLESLSQESADIYVSGRGAGIHGVSNGASGGIHIRGLGGSPNDQVLVVVDGVPDYQGIFGHPIPDAYVPFLLDRAQVIKGGDSVLYGTNAMGGVILLRSRFRDHDGFEIENDAAFGSYATVRERAAVLARWGEWDVAGGVSALKTDGHRAGAGGSDLVAQVAGRYRAGRGVEIAVSERLVHVLGADPGPASHPYADHTFDVWRSNTAVRVEIDRGSVQLALVPYLNAGVHRLFDGSLMTDSTSGLDASATIKLRRWADLVVGLAGDWIDGSYENRITRTSLPVRAMSDYALYSQITLRPIAPLSFVLGSRELFSTTWGPVLLYKAGARWDIGRGFHVRTRLDRSFRQPTLRELYLPFPVANPGLKPERSITWDFGAGFTSEHLDVGCTGYRTEAHDLIKYFGEWPAAEVVNIDRTVVWGVEGHVGLRHLGPFELRVSTSWQDVGRFTRQNPSAKLDARVGASKEFGPHSFGGSLTAEWVHGLYMADYSRRPMPDVFFVDLAARYRYTMVERGMSAEPYVLVQNLLDRRYAFIEDYPMPGLNVLAGLTLRM